MSVPRNRTREPKNVLTLTGQPRPKIEMIHYCGVLKAEQIPAYSGLACILNYNLLLYLAIMHVDESLS